MPLHPQSKFVLDLMASSGLPPVEQAGAVAARALREQLREQFARMAGPAPELPQVKNRAIPGPAGPIPIRIYWQVLGPALPVLLYFHGGGWVLGDIESYDAACRSLTHASGCIVVSVGYRLAPENPYPAALDDAFAATQFAAAHAAGFGGDPTRIAVGGDSAGGNLAAAVTLRARDEGGPPIRFQLLIYPATDKDDNSPSLEEFADGYFLTRTGMRWFWDQYVPDAAAGRTGYVSPLRAPNLAGLPPALVITAGYDPLRDQGEAYALRLREAGVPTACKRYGSAIHGFFQMGGFIDAGKEALAQAGAALREAMAVRAPAP